ncbi:MAG: alpha-galactosidase [Leadbetterella sp.]
MLENVKKILLIPIFLFFSIGVVGQQTLSIQSPKHVGSLIKNGTPYDVISVLINWSDNKNKTINSKLTDPRLDSIAVSVNGTIAYFNQEFLRERIDLSRNRFVRYTSPQRFTFEVPTSQAPYTIDAYFTNSTSVKSSLKNIAFSKKGNVKTQVSDNNINTIFSIENNLVKREIKLDKNTGRFSTEGFYLDNANYVVPTHSNEFSFLWNDKKITGKSGWNLKDYSAITDSTGGQGFSINLTEKKENPEIAITVCYMIYPKVNVVRKWMRINNIGNSDVKLEGVLTEDFHSNLIFYWSSVNVNYARQKRINGYTGNWDDPIMIAHDLTNQKGMALGNEAPGVIKRSCYHCSEVDTLERNNIEIGLALPNQTYPFRRWLKPNRVYRAPKTFIALYNKTDDPYKVVNNDVNKFIVRHMKPKVLQIKEKPLFVYNTWKPFMQDMSDSLIWDLAKVAAKCGIEEFIIDEGWAANKYTEGRTGLHKSPAGDWLVDTLEFSGGLKPSFDYIKSLGMKPGMWISLGAVTADAEILKKHPEWFSLYKDGKPMNVQNINKGVYTASFGTDWVDYIRNIIDKYVKQNGLVYGKMDFAVCTSAYINEINKTGSWATNHPFYRDHEESYSVLYERLLEFFDDVHEDNPELFIDCTYESTGKHHLQDYAFTNVAEGNWLSNINEPSPTGALRIRELAWWRSPAVPAASLVIGNLILDDPNYEFGLKSLIGTFPIVLGDLRKLQPTQINRLNQWSQWMRKMQEKHDYMTYRKDLPGFGEPKVGQWDGFQRLNFDTLEGGVVGVFRHGSKETTRLVILEDLIPDNNYIVRLAPEGKIIHKSSGKSLMEKGFMTTITKEYDGNIFEVERIK